jgi:hypothetical protein
MMQRATLAEGGHFPSRKRIRELRNGYVLLGGREVRPSRAMPEPTPRSKAGFTRVDSCFAGWLPAGPGQLLVRRFADHCRRAGRVR